MPSSSNPSRDGLRSFRSACVLLPALALGLVATSCSQTEGAGAPDDTGLMATGARRRETPRVRVAEVEQREMLQILETTTVLESEVEIQLRPRTTGMVVEVLAEEGDRVEVGTILARIDDRDAELARRDAEVALDEAKNRAETAALAVEEAFAAIENARLAANQAERDFDRNSRLFEGGEALPSALSAQALENSRLEFDRAKNTEVTAELAWKRAQVDERDAATAVARAEVALERAELTLEYTSIRAPFAGVVAERTIRVGDTAGTEPVFRLTDTENLRAVFFRPQRELGIFAGGRNGDGAGTELEVEAVAEALPGVVFRGRIERTSPTVDPESGSFRVTARLSITPEGKSEPRLLPGMLVRLSIVTDRHPDALVAPKRAVRREGELAYVLAVEEGIARRVEVEEGFSRDDFVELLPREEGSLSAGALLVAVGARELQDGSPVAIESETGEVEEPASEAVVATNDGDMDDAAEMPESAPETETSEAEASDA